MKIANLQKHWLEFLKNLFGKTALPAETQTKKLAHAVGMQPANQRDYSKCFWGDIDCASAPWMVKPKKYAKTGKPNLRTQIMGGTRWTPKNSSTTHWRTLIKKMLPRASQTSNRPHAKLLIPVYIRISLVERKASWNTSKTRYMPEKRDRHEFG